MISQMIQNQRRLHNLINKNHGEYEFKDAEEMIQKYMSYIVGETDEVNREVNYKFWKARKEVDWDKTHEELADIFIFWLDLMIKLDIDDVIFDVVVEKQLENIRRQEEDKDYKGDK